MPSNNSIQLRAERILEYTDDTGCPYCSKAKFDPKGKYRNEKATEMAALLKEAGINSLSNFGDGAVLVHYTTGWEWSRCFKRDDFLKSLWEMLEKKTTTPINA